MEPITKMLRLVVAVAMAAFAGVAVSGHVLDQFVEASRLQIGPDRVAVELDLTPGIELAPAMFFAINTNGDGEISTREGRSHAARVLQDLVLEVDGRRIDVELTSATYPTFEAMRAGTGTIRLRALAHVPMVTGFRRLHYRNNHRSDVGIYLVNALVPETTAIILGTPRRDPQQLSFDLDYEQRTSAAEAPGRAWWLSAVCLLGGTTYVSLRRWRRRRPVAQL